jgi:hypothetical protein
MKCKYDNSSIIAYMEGDLSDFEGEEFKQHIKSCEKCAKKLRILIYAENYFKQDTEIKQSLANNVMTKIDKNRYRDNTILTKIASVYYRNMSVWKTVLPATAAIILAVLVLQYGNNFIIGIKDNIVAGIRQMDHERNTQLNNNEIAFKTPAQSSVPTSAPTPAEEKETFVPDMNGIQEIMALSKEQVIERLGDNYEIVPAGAEHAEDGYRYEEYGMTIIFENTLSGTIIGAIECDEKVNINGVKLGMTIPEIENILGEGKKRELVVIEPEQPEYALFYIYSDKTMVWFGSMEEKGVTTELQIRRYSGPFPTHAPTTPVPIEDIEGYIPDMNGIQEIMALSKEQVIKRLGNNYKIVPAGAENAEEGYRYEKYGMTIIFYGSKIGTIECDEKVNINGVKLGMTIPEIKNILGEGETRSLVIIEPEQPKYALFYIYDNRVMVWFGSMEENGVTTELRINRYVGPLPTPVPTERIGGFIPDINGITEIMALNKEQVIERLGNN